MATLLPDAVGSGFFEYLLSLDTSELSIDGIRDGTIVMGKTPLLTISGPIAVVQLLETPILNCINFATLVCTNASRMVAQAGPHVKCVEFGLRRAQGPDGANSATKYASLGGFIGTSNVYQGM